MRFTPLLLLLLLTVITVTHAYNAIVVKPGVCLNMIVKNEAAVITRALESALTMISDWVIVDTGSTDGTQEIIRNFFKQHDVPGTLLEQPWVDFATNRNQALEAARSFSVQEYVLFLDADDIFVVPRPGYWLPDTMRQPQYLIRIKHGETEHARTMLVRRTAPCAWHGVLHEYVACAQSSASNDLVQSGLYLKVIGDGSSASNPNKYLEHVAILERAMLTEPLNSRYAFYLAQSYRDSGQPEKALKAYMFAASLKGWREEVFYALYQAAQLMEKQGYNVGNITQTYLAAHVQASYRVEAMHGLAAFLRGINEFNGCFVYAQLGTELLQMRALKSDTLFTETWVYDYQMWDEFSICAYYVGEYQQSLDASDRLLRSTKVPADMIPRVTANRAFAATQLGVK